MYALRRCNHVQVWVGATSLLRIGRIGQGGVFQEDGHDEDDGRLEQVEISSFTGEVQEVAKAEQLRIVDTQSIS